MQRTNEGRRLRLWGLLALLVLGARSGRCRVRRRRRRGRRDVGRHERRGRGQLGCGVRGVRGDVGGRVRGVRGGERGLRGRERGHERGQRGHGGRHRRAAQDRHPVRLRGRVRVLLRGGHRRRAAGADPGRRDRQGQAQRRPRRCDRRRPPDRDRGLRLRRRHGRQGDRGDSPPGRAARRRDPHRPALGRRGHRGRELRAGASRGHVHQRHLGRPGHDPEGAGAELLPLQLGWRAVVGRSRRLRVQHARLEDGRDHRRRLLVPVHVARRLRGRVLRARRRRSRRASGRRWARRTTRRSSRRSRRTSTVSWSASAAPGRDTFIKQYEQARGKIDGKKFMGNVFWPDPLVLGEIGAQLEGGVAAGPTAGDSTDPAAVDCAAASTRRTRIEGGRAPPRPCSRTTTTTRCWPSIAGLEAVGGDLSDGHAAFREALTGLTIDGGYGYITLDENRNAITDNYVQQVVKTDDGYGVKTILRVPASTRRSVARSPRTRRRPTARTRSARSSTRRCRGSATPRPSTTARRLIRRTGRKPSITT